jgi:23S rRNA (cytosine1962-C5)-methyltransferase
LRTLNLAKTGLNKIRAHQRELKANDIEESLKSLLPGEWCWLKHHSLNLQYLAFVNPMVDEKFASIHLVEQYPVEQAGPVTPEFIIESKLHEALERRKRFKDYAENSRIFYGVSDGLPGLIADKFGDKIIVQINTAGIDRYRSKVCTDLENLTGAKVFFLDNQKYREKEFLPVYENEVIPDLAICENGLSYRLRSSVMQKIGFYFDHRENRYQLMQLLNRLNRKFENGLDLFCYAGAWGLNALKGGVSHCTFVDQGDFEKEIISGLEMNGFRSQGSFLRQDVFKFLEEQIVKKQTFDLTLCDPPAFAKSHLQKDQALEGYSKLHRKVIKITSAGGLIAFSSCTHYVTAEEFQKNIIDAAFREGRRLQLLYCGMQGWDHPITSLADRSSYIKSFFYLLEN